MYHSVRKKMSSFIISAILLLIPSISSPKSIETTSSASVTLAEDDVDNNIIDFDEEYSVKFNKKYGAVPWHASDFNRNTHKYTLINDSNRNNDNKLNYQLKTKVSEDKQETTTQDYRVIPLELISTTEDELASILESTMEPDLTVIPLSTTRKVPNIKIDQPVTLPSTTESDNGETTEHIETSTALQSDEEFTTFEPMKLKDGNQNEKENTTATNIAVLQEINNQIKDQNVTLYVSTTEISDYNSTEAEKKSSDDHVSKEEDADVPIFTELDTEDLEDIPEDYYDSKDVLPTPAPKTDAISVLFGLAGSVVESVVETVAEKVVPKSIYDLFKRMQKQNEALEAERLRSREENGGLGQFGRGILKSLSSGLTRPLSQLMAGVTEAGSLDTDRGFLGNVASSVTSVANAANTYLEAFKDKVQAIYPGTVWCGDGHSATARSGSELGLFFFTDTCCRQHDACKIYIPAGETKYGLTNTGLFTRSHCSCDAKFRECLRRTNSLVSAQIGLTYFNVLGPQCFRRAHPIVRCAKRTRITGQKCEEYELDYTKPKMWQWFDNETF